MPARLVLVQCLGELGPPRTKMLFQRGWWQTHSGSVASLQPQGGQRWFFWRAACGAAGAGAPCWGPPSPEGREDPCPWPSGSLFLWLFHSQGWTERPGPGRGFSQHHQARPCILLGILWSPPWRGGSDGGGYIEKGTEFEPQVRPGAGRPSPKPVPVWATTSSQRLAGPGCHEGPGPNACSWGNVGRCRLHFWGLALSQDVGGRVGFLSVAAA